MSTSRKIADIKQGRIVEFPETETEKATALRVTGVKKYRTSVEVTGVKLTRAGKAHPSGKTHTRTVEVGNFLVTWEDVEAEAAVEVAAEVEAASPVE